MIKPDSRILIIRMSAIGDVIQTLPAIHSLRKSFPNAYLAWVVEPLSYNLLKGHPEIDELILFPKQQLKITLKEAGLIAASKILKSFAKNLQLKRFDVAIDFQNLFKSGLIAKLSKAKQRVGFGPGRELNRLFLNRILPPPVGDLHFIDWELELVSRLGADIAEVNFNFPDYHEEELVIKDFLESNSIQKPYFCIAPGTSWPNKCWTSDAMAQLADRLSAYGQVILIGTDLERSITIETINKMSSIPINALEKFNLRELAVLIKGAKIFFGGDTGPMHLAVALGTKAIAWMGPTKPSRTGPYPGRGTALALNLDCQPCHKRNCHNNLCLKNLPLETVWTAAELFLG